VEFKGTPFEVRFESRALKDLEKFSKEDQKRFAVAIRAFALTGVGDFKPLQGVPDYFRFRVATLRAEFFVLQVGKQMVVTRAFHRQAGYGKRARRRR
jgi:mRNA-degrading endonuclease RelE of RelBE toxin-antitoxin system